MPIVSSNATILVTGSNGFLGTWVVDTLLKRGFTVRAAVRSEARGQHLLKTFQSYGDKLQLFPIGDIAADGAFDEAVKAVEGIVHTAAKLSTGLEEADPRDVANTAIQGNLGILNSAQKYGTSLKRVVLTSSTGARTGFASAPKLVTGNDWNEDAVQACEKSGKATLGMLKYTASKTLAEKAAWEWYEKNKSSLNWELTAFSPPYIFGPVLHDIGAADSASFKGSNRFFHDTVAKGVNMSHPGRTLLDSPASGWIDVRDAAELHVRALETPAAAGERIIIAAGGFVWQDAIDAVNALPKSPWPSHKEPFTKGLSGEKQHYVTYDTSVEQRVFGYTFRTLQETASDMLADYERRGWA
ncbi:methylglyoxal reductase (NADPH-dependent) gre2 [Steccherinum ochraceum]|uniref:Methylglyoxal reductase (NADPH-dependent) gre2 n=1 Tax=Steccherinum ochraceum TaxID=92696 RepID=A0A4R0RNB6_9APHY|nr:methylglyoxal reductase (NADPH-dependent) gre2 [Steccherinum ochraceum]